MTCLLVYYFYYIFDWDYSSSVMNGLKCGALGGLAYFAKSYAFYFFIFHYALFNVFCYFRQEKDGKCKSMVVKNTICGF